MLTRKGHHAISRYVQHAKAFRQLRTVEDAVFISLYLRNMFSYFFLPFHNGTNTLLSPLDLHVDQFLPVAGLGMSFLLV